eukprot:jgi/Botrbrau1/16700/Bobra.0213s0004.2
MGIPSTYLPCSLKSRILSAPERSCPFLGVRSRKVFYNSFTRVYEGRKVSCVTRPGLVVCGTGDIGNSSFTQGAPALHGGSNRGRALTPAAAYVSVSKESYELLGAQEAANGQQAKTRDVKSPKFLWWCPTADDESRVVNYVLNGLVISTVFFAAISEGATQHVDTLRFMHLEAFFGYLNQISQFYVTALEAYPVLTKACISAVVYGLGDFTAQTYEGRSLEDLDPARAFRSSLCGFFVHGPLSHLFYLNLDRIFMYIKPFDVMPGWSALGLKVAIDQTAWSVTWNAAHYISLGILNFESPSVVVDSVKMTWWDSLKAGWRLWPFAHLITYSLPRDHRVLWVGIVELLWATVLSMYGQQQRKRLAAEMEAAGAEACSQVACVLPGAPAEGGSFTEEILRGIKQEGEVFLVSEDGQATAIPAVEVCH